MAGRFWGGKAKSGKRFALQLAEMMAPYWNQVDRVIEPFVGGGGLLVQMAKYFPSGTQFIASDVNPCVIEFLSAAKNGWVPPAKITREEFNYLKATKKQCSPMHFVVGYFTCFNGKYFLDNFRDSTNIKLAIAAKKIPKIAPYFHHVRFYLRDYRYYTPRNTRNALIICDPPYFGADRYQFLDSFLEFDHAAFYEWVMKMSVSNFVFFCDSIAPKEFKSVWNFSMKRNNKKFLRQSKEEHLFVWDNPANRLFSSI